MNTALTLRMSKKAWFEGADGYNDIKLLNINVDRGMVYFEGINAEGNVVRGELAMTVRNMNALCLAWFQRKDADMKCCKCGKEIDVTRHDLPPEWFAQYRGCEMIKVICRPCLKLVEISGHEENWAEDADE